jgi:hypothetical protein
MTDPPIQVTVELAVMEGGAGAVALGIVKLWVKLQSVLLLSITSSVYVPGAFVYDELLEEVPPFHE